MALSGLRETALETAGIREIPGIPWEISIPGNGRFPTENASNWELEEPKGPKGSVPNQVRNQHGPGKGSALRSFVGNFCQRTHFFPGKNAFSVDFFQEKSTSPPQQSTFPCFCCSLPGIHFPGETFRETGNHFPGEKVRDTGQKPPGHNPSR